MSTDLDLSFLHSRENDELEEILSQEMIQDLLGKKAKIDEKKPQEIEKEEKTYQVDKVTKLRNIEAEKGNLIKKHDRFLNKLGKIRTEYDTLKGNMKIVFDVLFEHKEKDGTLVFEIGAVQDLTGLTLDKVKSALQSLERREFLETIESKKGINGYRRIRVLKKNNSTKS